MIRKIITIDTEKCNGCGLCVTACHEGAIVMENGKAKLLRDDYCDGLGDCLPACPAKAISFEEREAAPYDEEAVKARMAAKNNVPPPCGCPGAKLTLLPRKDDASAKTVCEPSGNAFFQSELRQWPIQLKLVPANAPYFAGAHLLIAADCTAYAYGNFHPDFMKGRVTLIGCPKLDAGDYTEKLTAILQENTLLSVTVVKMEVPCCNGMESAVRNALLASGKLIPWWVHTISTDGKRLGGLL